MDFSWIFDGFLGYLMSSLLVQVPQALSFRCFEPWAKCPVRRYVAPARNSSLQEQIHQFWIQRFILKSGFKKNLQHRADFHQKKATKNIFLTFETIVLILFGGNHGEIRRLLVRFYEEITQKGGSPSPITQPEP